MTIYVKISKELILCHLYYNTINHMFLICIKSFRKLIIIALRKDEVIFEI